ncbi:MAG: 4Fe-4S dicluster domain-containing protein [candidate division Zixibacteria bacterium]|nr:4Fe-4S dicluster domain-containing protein [candidate division Zixibacteria bacterium]
MAVDRRKFLKAAGLVAFGVAASPLTSAAQEVDSLNLIKPEELLQEKPLTAKRWAMVIDLKKCLDHENVKDCAKACHEEHNVPFFDNPKDEIKWIWDEEFHNAFHEANHEHIAEKYHHIKVPVLCNHCDNPPCVRVCPTQATWRREKDGIVMMDWHRCIGCRYCIVACPYGSRSFNWRDPRPHIEKINENFPRRMRGVVEKCTFCEERLAKGQIPACVEVAKNDAIVFGDLEDPNSKVRELLRERFSLRRKAALGTQPEVYYLV